MMAATGLRVLPAWGARESLAAVSAELCQKKGVRNLFRTSSVVREAGLLFPGTAV
jgi:hypothetical protein